MSHFLPHNAERAILLLLEDLASPRALTVSILWRYGEWDQLATLKLSPEHYLDPEAYWRDATATEVVRKLEDLPTSFERDLVAEDNFLLCERECLRTNRRLYSLTELTHSDSYSSDLHDYFRRARKIVEGILGPCPDSVEGRFGPGATYGDRGQFCTVPDKMSSEPTFTTDAWPFLVPWTGTLWASACASSGKSPTSVSGNRFTTVPKDSTKFRGIAIEPSINVFYQLAYGKVIRQRLRRRGVNLDLGQDLHRHTARVASSAGHLATLDLSNASDTICNNLVKLLLPPKWYDVLNSLRSKKTIFRGHPVLLEKFSSMGNGFTFELETLLFLSLVAAICGEDLIGSEVLAFGDDLIFPSSRAKDVMSMLHFCGLTVNMKKTFFEGNFRESCGGDFFSGVAVRPHFLKKSPNEPQEMIAFANGLRRCANQHIGREFIIRRAWLTILEGIPSSIRCLRGPQDLGDIVIHDYRDRWSTRHQHGIRYVKCYKPASFRKVRWEHFTPDVILASATYGLASGSQTRDGTRWSSAGVTPRSAVLGYKIGWVAFS